MPDLSTLFVAGLGRCGTTMVMNMLLRGGFPVAGPKPAFEVTEMSPGRVDLSWVRAQGGKAVKWIDPLHARISRNDLPASPIIIAMTRDPQEQAKSQMKLLRTFGAPVADDRRTRRAFQASLKDDADKMHWRLQHTGTVFHLSFEFILRDPKSAANKLAAICRFGFEQDLDEAAAASVVLRRSPLCATDMAVEVGYNA